MTILFPIIALFCGFYQLSTILIYNERSPNKSSYIVLALWTLLYSMPGIVLYVFIVSVILPQISALA